MAESAKGKEVCKAVKLSKKYHLYKIIVHQTRYNTSAKGLCNITTKAKVGGRKSEDANGNYAFRVGRGVKKSDYLDFTHRHRLS